MPEWALAQRGKCNELSNGNGLGNLGRARARLRKASGKFGVMSWTARLYLLGTFVANLFKSRRRLELENLFLRHQLNIALRRAPYRLRLDG